MRPAFIIVLMCACFSLGFVASADAHRYDRWGRDTLNDFNYAVVYVCGGGAFTCYSRKTENNIGVWACTDHSWCTRTRTDHGTTSDWTHIEQTPLWHYRRCYTRAKSYHGQLEGIDRGGPVPSEFCDPMPDN